jgi:hypothetical protein
MTDDRSDSIFKLRLSGPLRARLEKEAAKRGLTLTAEILRRIDETFSETSDRLSALEKIVFDGDMGNESLSHGLQGNSREIEELRQFESYVMEAFRRR